MPQATGLVAELKEAFGDKVQTNLIKGSQGVFDVVVDGERVYAKSETGR
ncbi:MAG: Rdx family protein, partial [Phycisphaerae bacterium]